MPGGRVPAPVDSAGAAPVAADSVAPRSLVESGTAGSSAAGVVEVPAVPDFACVSVID
jgi:hypothetical protein